MDDLTNHPTVRVKRKNLRAFYDNAEKISVFFAVHLKEIPIQDDSCNVLFLVTCDGIDGIDTWEVTRRVQVNKLLLSNVLTLIRHVCITFRFY